MSEKIYEYKTDTDWYVAQWSREYGMVNSFEHYRDVYELLRPFEIVTGEEAGGVNIHIIRHQSDFHLLSFVAKIVAEHTGRQLDVQTRAGAVLLMEGDRLLHVSLPESGIPVQDFLGSSKQTLLIATRNEGKTREFRAIFEKMGYEVENLNAYPDLPEVAETGVTFEENARLKAETISRLTGKMVLADDSGLKVDILGGMPGVWSARFAGVGASDLENNAKLLHELAMVFEKKDRSAQFHTTLVVAAPDKDSLVVEADWPGYIAFQAKGENGFGYDPLFLIGETDQTSAELSLEEKNSQSHRAQAVKKLVEVFPAWQSKPSS